MPTATLSTSLVPRPDFTDRRLSARLDREWHELCRRPAVLDSVRAWGVTPLPFASLPELLTLAGLGRGHDDDAGSDEVLRRLVAAAAGEPLAARIVLQRLLPGLLAIVRREQSRDRSVDAFELLVGEAWLSIVGYDAGTRRTDVAARLLNDARHRAFTAPRRRRHHRDEELVAPADLARNRIQPTRSAFEELVELLRQSRRRLSDDDLAVVRDYLADETARHRAAVRKVTPRTLRNRRRRTLTKLRRLAA